MGKHKVCEGKNEMWGLIPKNTPGRGGNVKLEGEPWKGVRGCHPRENFLNLHAKL